MLICDNKRHILAISRCEAGNHHDSFQICQKFEQMTDSISQLGDLTGSYLNADAGFDNKKFRKLIVDKNLIPNIKRNKRNAKKNLPSVAFDTQIYKQRFQIEAIFGQLDHFKRVLIRFDFLASHFEAWLFIASSLFNFH